MKNKFNYLLIIMNVFFSGFVLSKQYIFECIEKKDLKCIDRELSFNGWRQAKNEAEQSPLRYAISKKNMAIIKRLLNAGAEATAQDVIYTLKQFYGVDITYFYGANEPYKNDNNGSLLTMEKMLIALDSDENIEERTVELVNIVELFCSNKEFANLLQKSKIHKTTIERIIYEYKTLFLFHINNEKDMAKIVYDLIELGVEKYLILLIIDSYSISLNKEGESLRVEEKNLFNRTKQENIVSTIFEISRSKYAKVHPKDFFKYVLFKKTNKDIDDIIAYGDKLAIFVQQSITVPSGTKRRVKNYKFWHEVLNGLMEKGDFLGAFNISLGLNNSNVLKKISIKQHLPNPLVDSSRSFKNYRQSANPLNGFYIPALNILFKDLTAISEFGFFINENDTEKLNRKSLVAYKDFLDAYLPSHFFAQKPRYKSKKYLFRAIATLPEKDIKIESIRFREIYDIVFHDKVMYYN